MAGGAVDGAMRGPQRKFRGIMIERLDTRPDVFAVALVALLPKLTFVRINRFVTIDAERGGAAELRRLRMAVAAGS